MHKLINNGARIAAVACGAFLSAGCSMDTLVRATDPDIIGVELVNSPSAANALRVGTLGRFNAATTGGETMLLFGGLFGDEFSTGDTFTTRIETDQRALTPQNGQVTTAYRFLHRARVSAIQTRDALATFAPLAPAWNYGEMFFVEAYMINQLAEHFCNGQPISTVNNGVESYGDPLPNTAHFALALAKVDSGLARVGAGTTADDARVRNSLNVLRARILLNQGNFGAVAATVANVPTNFTWNQEHSLTSRTPGVWAFVNNQRRYMVANNEGPLRMDFASSGDPRTPTCTATQAACIALGLTNPRPFDNQNSAVPNITYQLIWTADASSVSLLNGLQARLFEAEALNRTGNFAGALTILNALRASPPNYGRVIAAMPPLTDPGTDAARRDLIFREKGFWLYGTGHRFGDMRRMMRQYGMTANQVFPNGNTWQINRAPGYGNDVVFPTPTAETFNPKIPQVNGEAQCIDRNP